MTLLESQSPDSEGTPALKKSHCATRAGTWIEGKFASKKLRPYDVKESAVFFIVEVEIHDSVILFPPF